MTAFHRESIECPYCLNEEELVIWDVIDVDEDPDLAEKLLLKELQNYECQNCNHVYILERPLLYMDNTAHLMCYLTPAQRQLFSTRDSREADGTLLRTLKDELPLDFGRDLTGYTLRIVTSYNDLIEKIHISRQGLSDRLIEIVKLAVKTRLTEENVATIQQSDVPTEEKQEALKATEITELRYLGTEDNVMLWQTFSDANGWQQLELEPVAYRNTESMLKDRLPAEGSWDLVDQRFAEAFIQSLS